MIVTLRIARFGMRDLGRSRWLAGYTLFFAFATWLLLRVSDTEQKALVSLVSVVLFVVPLASIVFGAIYLYSSREFVELMLAQPVRRSRLFAGVQLGLSGSMALAVAVGLGVPLLLLSSAAGSLEAIATLVGLAIALSCAFTGLAAVVGYWVEDRVRGLAIALGLWLLLAIAYDALLLLLVTQFADYPVERGMAVAIIANPIDLARLILLFQFDMGALLGYTGAVFERFLGARAGVITAAIALCAWAVFPAALGRRLFQRKDF